MTTLGQLQVRNRLLGALSPEDFHRLRGHLEPFELVARKALIPANAPIANLYFVETGIVSILAQTDDDRIEVGMVGSEGFAGISAILGSDRCANPLVVQAPGHALRVPAEILREAFEASGGLRTVLLRYVQCLMAQMSRTAYANARFGIKARLARWILMTNDRLDTDDLPLTHEFLSAMLGTRRSSITNAMHVLEGNGVIRTRRANIVVQDRVKLREMAGDSYGPPEAEDQRLLGAAA